MNHLPIDTSKDPEIHPFVQVGLPGIFYSHQPGDDRHPLGTCDLLPACNRHPDRSTRSFPMVHPGRFWSRIVRVDAGRVHPAPLPLPLPGQDTKSRADILPVPRRASCPAPGQDPPGHAIPGQHPDGSDFLRVVHTGAGGAVESEPLGQPNGSGMHGRLPRLRPDTLCNAPFPHAARICQVHQALPHGASL